MAIRRESETPESETWVCEIREGAGVRLLDRQTYSKDYLRRAGVIEDLQWFAPTATYHGGLLTQRC